MENKYIHPSNRTTQEWMKESHMWRSDLSKKELYQGAKFLRTFNQLSQQFPLHIVQKRNGF